MSRNLGPPGVGLIHSAPVAHVEEPKQRGVIAAEVLPEHGRARWVWWTFSRLVQPFERSDVMSLCLDLDHPLGLAAGLLVVGERLGMDLVGLQPPDTDLGSTVWAIVPSGKNRICLIESAVPGEGPGVYSGSWYIYVPGIAGASPPAEALALLLAVGPRLGEDDAR